MGYDYQWYNKTFMKSVDIPTGMKPFLEKKASANAEAFKKNNM
ncbi:MAG: hypothetical protein H6Q26_1244 [Bacteroidetes bacterium]|nr:hypothetical protein [Bacteroidota bacterium]